MPLPIAHTGSYVQAYFEKLSGFDLAKTGATVTVRVPASNILNPGAIRSFARYRDQILEQMRGRVTHEE